MKKPFAVLATGALVASLLTPMAAFASNFSDTSGLSQEAQNAINDLVAKQIVNGYPNGTFNPYGSITRAEFLKIVELAAKVPVDNSVTQSQYFNDVPSWAARYVDAAYKAGITNGTGNGQFSPNATITREQAAKFAVAALGYQADANPSLSFSDAGSISSWAKGFVSKAVSLGLIKGNSDNTFAPAANAARWQAAIIGDREVSATPNQALKVTGTATSAAVGQAVQFTVNQGTPTWSVSPSTASIQNGQFIASAPGNYTVTATEGNQTATATVAVYGQAAGVKLSTPTDLVANGVSTETITATVVDANGNTVQNFNGSANLTDSNAVGANNAAALPNPATVTFTNGVGTFVLTASNNVGKTDTISLNTLTSTNGQSIATSVSYPSVQVKSVTQAPAAIGLKPTTATLSDNNAANVDQVAVAINDATGNAIVGGPSQYVTLTISGPGSFSQVAVGGTPTTTQSFYTNGTNVNVYPVQGQSGTITITATAPGLTNGTATISSVATGQPANIKLNSTQGTLSSTFGAYAKGTQFTLYTVQLVDANGNAVVPGGADNLTISDNSASSTPAGSLQYFAVTNGQPSGAAWNPAGGPYTQAIGATTGQLQFAVLNQQVGGAPATITVTDGLTSNKQTATYSYATGAASKVTLPTGAQSSVNVLPSANVTFTVQLQDSQGNNLSTSGVPVNFYFTGGNSAAATIANSTGWTNANAYVVNTDSNGKATVTVAVPSGAAAASTFTVDAAYNGQAVPVALTGTVQAASTYATSVALGNASKAAGYTPVSADLVTWPTSPIAANTTVQTAVGSAIYAFAENSIGQIANTTDTIQITTSNPSVLGITAGGAWSQVGTGTVTTVQGAASNALPNLTGLQVGTATVTITDVSNPNAPSVTETVSVNQGAYAGDIILYNGKQISSSNPLPLTANTPVQLTVVHADGGGNPVPVTGSNDYVGLSDNGNQGQFEATSGGAAIGSVKIAVSQSSATVYYVNPTTQSVTNPAFFTLTDNVTAPNAGNIAWDAAFVSTASTFNKIDLTNVRDANGNLYNGTLTFSTTANHAGAGINTSGTGAVAATATVTITNGVGTLYYETGTAAAPTTTDTISVTSSGWTMSLATPSY